MVSQTTLLIIVIFVWPSDPKECTLLISINVRPNWMPNNPRRLLIPSPCFHGLPLILTLPIVNTTIMVNEVLVMTDARITFAVVQHLDQRPWIFNIAKVTRWKLLKQFLWINIYANNSVEVHQQRHPLNTWPVITKEYTIQVQCDIFKATSDGDNDNIQCSWSG